MSLFEPIRSAGRKLASIWKSAQRLERDTALIREALGRIEQRQLASKVDGTLNEHEFRVFSQWGEDGILAHLLRHVVVPAKTFVEFGVENYSEANTRWILVNGGWSGL